MHGLAETGIDQLLVELTAKALWREPPSASPAPYPGDDHLRALLAAHHGSVLISGDRMLLNKPLPGLSVISPITGLDSFVGRGDRPA